jgi:hypothetical protein
MEADALKVVGRKCAERRHHERALGREHGSQFSEHVARVRQPVQIDDDRARPARRLERKSRRRPRLDRDDVVAGFEELGAQQRPRRPLRAEQQEVRRLWIDGR